MKIKTILTVLLPLVTNIIHGLPIDGSGGSSLVKRSNNTKTSYSAGQAHTSSLASSSTAATYPMNITTQKELLNFTRDALAQFKKEDARKPLTKKDTQITSQQEFNQAVNALVKQAIAQNTLSSPYIPSAPVLQSPTVDISPCLTLIQNSFPNITLSVREACEFAYTENFPDYANRESISHDKALKLGLGIGLGVGLGLPAALYIVIAAACCGCAMSRR